MESAGLARDVLRAVDQRAVDLLAGNYAQTCAVVGIVTRIAIGGDAAGLRR